MKLLYYLLGLTNTFVFFKEQEELIWSVHNLGDTVSNDEFVRTFAKANKLVEDGKSLTTRGELVVCYLYHKLFYVESPRAWMMGKVLRLNKQQEIDYNNKKIHLRNYADNLFTIITVIATCVSTMVAILFCSVFN